MGRGTWGLAAAFALAACVVPDPNHCANRERDATCMELGLGQYCSACAATNFGCVQETPEAACYPDGAASSSSTGSTTSADTGSGSEDESSSGPPPSCMEDGQCPEGNPYCIDGTCGTCDLAAEGFCAEFDAATPVCHEAWGRCVECTEVATDACGGMTPFCGPDFTCSGCLQHEQCPSSACDLSRGSCLPDDNVHYVDNEQCAGGLMTGTSADPFCTIAEGIDAVGAGGRGTVIVRGGTSYSAGILTQNSRTVAILGQQSPSIIASGSEGARVSNGDKLYIANAQVRSGNGVGLRCDGDSELWLDNVLVDNNVTGIVAGPCELHIHRSRIILSDEVGVQLDEATHMVMTSSAVVGNSSTGAWPAINSVNSTFEITYSTVVADGDATIECAGGTAGPVRNSVLVSNDLESLACPWAQLSYTLHDGGNAMAGGDGNVLVGAFDPAWFDGLASNDVHVAAPSSSPFADVARWEVGDPIRDLDGDRREATPGVRNFAGADEP